MLTRSRLLRFILGLVLMAVVLYTGFSIASALIWNFGATKAEETQVLPGDELLNNPPIRWRHAITIKAKPEAVWPWIIQMGDNRAGFYSYTFIERKVDPTPGLYVNADRIHPEWQTPTPGLSIIANGGMVIKDYQANQYMLGVADEKKMGMGWTWVWYISPTADGNTRLNIHMAILPPGGPDNPLVSTFVGLGAFILERNMMTGLALRAEGGMEPAWIETVEAALWFGLLLIGLAAAGRYVFSAQWQRPLAVALVSVGLIFVFTFLQPAIWLRVVIELAMLAALLWSFGVEPKVVTKPALQAA